MKFGSSMCCCIPAAEAAEMFILGKRVQSWEQIKHLWFWSLCEICGRHTKLTWDCRFECKYVASGQDYGWIAAFRQQWEENNAAHNLKWAVGTSFCGSCAKWGGKSHKETLIIHVEMGEKWEVAICCCLPEYVWQVIHFSHIYTIVLLSLSLIICSCFTWTL